MIKETKPIKSTSSIPYGMLMILVFKHFKVSLNGELVDTDVLSLAAKNVVSLKLSPQPGIERAWTCSDENDD